MKNLLVAVLLFVLSGVAWAWDARDVMVLDSFSEETVVPGDLRVVGNVTISQGPIELTTGTVLLAKISTASVCDVCKGTGIREAIFTNYDEPYDPVIIPKMNHPIETINRYRCEKCSGTGKVWSEPKEARIEITGSEKPEVLVKYGTLATRSHDVVNTVTATGPDMFVPETLIDKALQNILRRDQLERERKSGEAKPSPR